MDMRWKGSNGDDGGHQSDSSLEVWDQEAALWQCQLLGVEYVTWHKEESSAATQCLGATMHHEETFSSCFTSSHSLFILLGSHGVFVCLKIAFDKMSSFGDRLCPTGSFA